MKRFIPNTLYSQCYGIGCIVLLGMLYLLHSYTQQFFEYLFLLPFLFLLTYHCGVSKSFYSSNKSRFDAGSDECITCQSISLMIIVLVGLGLHSLGVPGSIPAMALTTVYLLSTFIAESIYSGITIYRLL